MGDHVLDLIDNVLDDYATSCDAMRWAPDAADPTPAGLPAPRLLVPVVTDADLAAMRQAADTAGWFMGAIAAQLRPVMEAIGKAITEFMAAVEPAAIERRVRVRHLHTEYRRRTRRRNRGR